MVGGWGGGDNLWVECRLSVKLLVVDYIDNYFFQWQVCLDEDETLALGLSQNTIFICVMTRSMTTYSCSMALVYTNNAIKI
jgi:hypothetical protein